MTFSLSKHKSDFLFVPLGGAGEIGMNFNLYHYLGKWIVVDCGAGFADARFPGIDMTVPDIQFIIAHKKNLLAMILTHAHEDHVGAVQHLWSQLECPIYTTPFTAEFLKIRLADNGTEPSGPIHAIRQGHAIDLDPFKIELVPLAHSAPEMQALAIKTQVGTVFHTGDWKFDHRPMTGEVNDEALLAQYGNEGVLAVIGDSTNVFSHEHSGSEGELKESLTEIITSCKQMVVVGIFASNVGRLDAIMEAARIAKRKVLLLGSSLKRIVKAAKASGYLKKMPQLLDEKSASQTKRSSLLVVATGCQGEELAAITKLSKGAHTSLRISEGDSVIFSSKVIPGNEKRIFAVWNSLTRLGAEVITEKDHFVHVSGHPSRVELHKLYSLLKPHLLIPVHGEYVHMHEHAKIARQCGIKHALQVENGDVVKLGPGEHKIVGSVEVGEFGIYGNYFLSPDSQVMQVRRRLVSDGIMVVALTKRSKENLECKCVAPGYLHQTEDADVLRLVQSTVNELLSDSNLSGIDLEKLVIQKVKSVLKREVGRLPFVQVIRAE